MISLPLYKQGMKGSWKLLLIFAMVLTMYFTIIVTMFDPKLGSALNELAKSMPEMMSVVGMYTASTTLVGFMSAYLYGFIMLVFPMVFSILTANRLVARHVERGSMAYLLAAPVKRSKVAFTQMKVLTTGIFSLMLYATLVGWGSCQAFFPGELDVQSYLLLNVGALCLQLFIGAICFVSSCIFNDTKYSISFGAGIPALGFIIQMIANYGGDLEKAKYVTFFTLFNADGILAREASALWGMGILFVAALALFCTGIAIFSKKDLPI